MVHLKKILIKHKIIIIIIIIIIVEARQPEGTIKTVYIRPMAQFEDIYLSEDGQIMLLWEWQKRKR